jgi:hypothetical protein
MLQLTLCFGQAQRLVLAAQVRRRPPPLLETGSHYQTQFLNQWSLPFVVMQKLGPVDVMSRYSSEIETDGWCPIAQGFSKRLTQWRIPFALHF